MQMKSYPFNDIPPHGPPLHASSESNDENGAVAGFHRIM